MTFDWTSRLTQPDDRWKRLQTAPSGADFTSGLTQPEPSFDLSPFRHEAPEPADRNPLTFGFNLLKGAGQGIQDTFANASRIPKVGGALSALGAVATPINILFGAPAVATQGSARQAFGESYKTLGGDQPAPWDFPALGRAFRGASESRADELRQIAESTSVGLPERGLAAFGQAFYGVAPNFAPLAPGLGLLRRTPAPKPVALPAPKQLALPAPRPETPVPMSGAIAQPTRYTPRGPLISIDDLRPKTQIEFERGLPEAPLGGEFRELPSVRPAPIATSPDIARLQRRAIGGTRTTSPLTLQDLQAAVDRSSAALRARTPEQTTQALPAAPRRLTLDDLRARGPLSSAARVTTDETLMGDLAESIRVRGGTVPEGLGLGMRERAVHAANEAVIAAVQKAASAQGRAAEQAWADAGAALDRVQSLGGDLAHTAARIRAATGFGPTAGELQSMGRARGASTVPDRGRGLGSAVGDFLRDEAGEATVDLGIPEIAKGVITQATRVANARRPLTVAERIDAGQPQKRIVAAREKFFARLRDVELPYRVVEKRSGWQPYDAVEKLDVATEYMEDARHTMSDQQWRVRDLGADAGRLRYQIESQDASDPRPGWEIRGPGGEVVRGGDRAIPSSEVRPGDQFRYRGEAWRAIDFDHGDLVGENVLNGNEQIRVPEGVLVNKVQSGMETTFAIAEEARTRAADLNAKRNAGALRFMGGASDFMSDEAGLARVDLGLSDKITMDRLLSAINLPKALKASMDISAPFRQGILLSVGHPTEFIGAIRPMIRSLTDDAYARRVQAEIKRVKRPGLYIAEFDGTLATREEAFISNLADKIPGISASNRAYAIFLNKLRADVYDSVLASWRKSGKKVANEDVTGLANVINHFTGRGDLPGGADAYTAALNAMFFSPRFAISRVQAVGDALGVVKNPSSLAAREAASDLAKFVIAGTAVLILAKLAGRDVETDPRSSAFGKIQMTEDTSVDIWGGMQPVARYVAQFLTGESKPITGRNAGKVVVAKRDVTLGRYFESKLSPSAGAVRGILRGADKNDPEGTIGTNFIGRKFTLADLLNPIPGQSEESLVVPLGWDDIASAVKADIERGGSGLAGLLIGALGLIGFGVQTIDREEPTSTPVPRPAPSRTAPARTPSPFRTPRLLGR